MAAAVLRAPSERIFGMEIVGRHHDPFTVMQQFERPITVGMYSQPVTDITGTLLARAAGPVAAYNWLVLLSFPLAAAAAYLLARHLALSRSAATIAALAYAFSPFHLAQAAYHPHIAQTQWVPLYLLALWRCLDAATPAAVAFLGLATLAVTLSNFYGGLIAAVITPAAVAAYWLVMRPAHKRPTHALALTVVSLVLVAACGLAYASYAAQAVVADAHDFAVPRVELFHYSAKWWSYLVPPVAHPLLGPAVHRMWNAAGVRDGLLEQQVSLGWGIVALGGIAVGRWLWHIRNRQSACGVRVPALIVVAAHRARLLAVAGAPDWNSDCVRAVGAAVRPRADVPRVRAVRSGRAADGGSARRRRCGFSASRRHQARAVLPASPSWPSSRPSTLSRPGHCGAMCCPPLHIGGSHGNPATCGRSTVRR